MLDLYLPHLLLVLYWLVHLCNFQVPYTVIDQNTRDKLPPTVVKWYSSTRSFELTSSYGLFRRYVLFSVPMLILVMLIVDNQFCWFNMLYVMVLNQ